jgi:2-hydroxycyclohexanecarboxyl-CoA dehydrogenase
MSARRVAFVTGGAKGIGAAISERLAADGFDVVVGGRDREAAEAHAQRFGGRTAIFDVADPGAVAAGIEAIGPVDVLVNNAGQDLFGWFTEVPYETMRRIIAVNFESVLLCTQAVLPGMQERRWGRIITIGSEAGRIGSKGNAVYAGCKGAVVAWTKSIARENARFTITANVVSPGPIETPLLREMAPHAIETVTKQTQLGRLGTPEEVAAPVSWLASEESSYITGETLGVSGGMALGG